MEKNQTEFYFYPEVKEGESRRVIAGYYNPETNTLTIGKSECSIKDNFNKIKGRKIALGRAKCTHQIKPKYHAVIKTKNNLDLLPKVYQLESNEKVQNQFIQIAKSI